MNKHIVVGNIRSKLSSNMAPLSPSLSPSLPLCLSIFLPLPPLSLILTTPSSPLTPAPEGRSSQISCEFQNSLVYKVRPCLKGKEEEEEEEEEKLKEGVRGPLIRATLLCIPHGMFRNVLLSGISKLHMFYIME